MQFQSNFANFEPICILTQSSTASQPQLPKERVISDVFKMTVIKPRVIEVVLAKLGSHSHPKGNHIPFPPFLLFSILLILPKGLTAPLQIGYNFFIT